MKRLLVVGCLLVLVAGCADPFTHNYVEGSGNLVSRSFPLDGFDQIDANGYAQIVVTRGEPFQVEVQIDDDLVDLLDVRVVGTTLKIGLQGGKYGKIHVNAQVTMPELIGVKLNGGTRVEGVLAGEDLNVDLNGGAELVLTGSAGRVRIAADGGSEALLGDLEATDVDVDANGGAQVAVRASGIVRGTANGGATVTVTGSPATVDIDTEGGARVITR